MKKIEIQNSYVTELDGISIFYSVKQLADEPVDTVNARIVRTASGEYLGTSNVDRSGAIGLNIVKGVTLSEKKGIIESVLDDTDAIFREAH